MLTLWGSRHRFCDGISRRSFLQIGAFGAALTLADLLRLRATAGAPSSSKSAIMIQLGGGPSHLDMYDLKPEAPVEYRGEFKPIRTNVPGVQICEHFPMQARMWDKLACSGKCSQICTPGTLVAMGLNSPRNSLGASGFRSYMSRCDGPPGR